jgi:uncharacterized SAM-binding protein YcdF (DUF218 family)
MAEPDPARSRTKSRFGGWRIVLLAFGAVLGLFFGGFALFAAHVARLDEPATVEGADAIIVLTGGHLRLNAGIELLRSGKGSRLLISGVNPIASRDDLKEATGADPALFSCCVDLDHAALDTAGNAAESAKWVRAHAFDSVILVTNNYHMPRTLLEMRPLLRGARIQAYPVVNTPLKDGGWLAKPDAVRVLFIEYVKYLAALARTFLPVNPRPDPASSIIARQQTTAGTGH